VHVLGLLDLGFGVWFMRVLLSPVVVFLSIAFFFLQSPRPKAMADPVLQW
jgi:hypothetical protein